METKHSDTVSLKKQMFTSKMAAAIGVSTSLRNSGSLVHFEQICTSNMYKPSCGSTRFFFFGIVYAAKYNEINLEQHARLSV